MFDSASKFRCSGCDATYYGKTKGNFKVKMSKQVRVFAVIRKK